MIAFFIVIAFITFAFSCFFQIKTIVAISMSFFNSAIWTWIVYSMGAWR